VIQAEIQDVPHVMKDRMKPICGIVMNNSTNMNTKKINEIVNRNFALDRVNRSLSSYLLKRNELIAFHVFMIREPVCIIIK